MTSYAPPQENVPVFDAGLFRTAGGDPLSEAYLRTVFLQYPVAQTGLETLSETKTTGQSEFNGTMINTSTIPYPDNTTKVPTTAWVNLAVAGGGGGSILGTNNLFTGTNEFQNTTQFDSALIISNGKQNTSLGNGFLPLASGQGNQNVFVGVGAGSSALCGDGNTVAGYFAASQGMTSAAIQNVLYGSRAGQYLTSGSGNTLIGTTTYNNVSTGNSNICLGNGAMGGESSGAYSNNIVIGNGIVAGGGNKTIIGTTTQTSMDLKVIDTPLSGGVIRMNNNLSMNNIQAAANRQINSSYYNFYDVNTVASLLYTGRLYGAVNSIVYDCPDTNSSGSSNHIFYCYNGAVATNILQINTAEVTNSTMGSVASTNSSTKVPTTAWVQRAITNGGLKQAFNYQFFNSATTVPASTSVQMIVPYVNAVNFSWIVRLEVNYAIYASNSATSAVDPVVLSTIVGSGGQTNVNPNTQAIVDLTFATSARTTIAQSTNSGTLTVQNYFPNNILGPYAYTPLSVGTANNSPSSGLSTITLTVGFPAVPYTSTGNYKGNITAASVSIRIISSMTTATSTPTTTNSSTGIAYFV